MTKELTITIRQNPLENNFIMRVSNHDKQYIEVKTRELHTVPPRKNNETIVEKMQEDIAYALIEAFQQIAYPMVAHMILKGESK